MRIDLFLRNNDFNNRVKCMFSVLFFFYLFKPATSKVYGFDSHVVLLVLCNMPFSGGVGEKPCI